VTTRWVAGREGVGVGARGSGAARGAAVITAACGATKVFVPANQCPHRELRNAQDGHVNH